MDVTTRTSRPSRQGCPPFRSSHRRQAMPEVTTSPSADGAPGTVPPRTLCSPRVAAGGTDDGAGFREWGCRAWSGAASKPGRHRPYSLVGRRGHGCLEWHGDGFLYHPPATRPWSRRWAFPLPLTDAVGHIGPRRMDSATEGGAGGVPPTDPWSLQVSVSAGSMSTVRLALSPEQQMINVPRSCFPAQVKIADRQLRVDRVT